VAADQGKAFALFKMALSYEDIAGQLACSVDEAREAVMAAIAASPLSLDQSSARIVALERLQQMHAGIWAKAIRGDSAAIDRVLKIEEARERLLGEPTRVQGALLEAFEKSLAALGAGVTDADETLVAACRQVARQIDHAVANGSSLEATKALYLLPHLWNGLRELGATPAARAALQAAAAAGSRPAADDDDDKPKEAPVDLDAWKRGSRG
jgi:hypothetical protein